MSDALLFYVRESWDPSPDHFTGELCGPDGKPMALETLLWTRQILIAATCEEVAEAEYLFHIRQLRKKAPELALLQSLRAWIEPESRARARVTSVFKLPTSALHFGVLEGPDSGQSAVHAVQPLLAVRKFFVQTFIEPASLRRILIPEGETM